MPYWAEDNKPDRDDLEPFDMWGYDQAIGLNITTRYYRIKGRCMICSRVLDQEDEPESIDCGGDCMRCVAEAGDTYSVLLLSKHGIEIPDFSNKKMDR